MVAAERRIKTSDNGRSIRVDDDMWAEMRQVAHDRMCTIKDLMAEAWRQYKRGAGRRENRSSRETQESFTPDKVPTLRDVEPGMMDKIRDLMLSPKPDEKILVDLLEKHIRRR